MPKMTCKGPFSLAASVEIQKWVSRSGSRVNFPEGALSWRRDVLTLYLLMRLSI